MQNYDDYQSYDNLVTWRDYRPNWWGLGYLLLVVVTSMGTWHSLYATGPCSKHTCTAAQGLYAAMLSVVMGLLWPLAWFEYAWLRLAWWVLG